MIINNNKKIVMGVIGHDIHSVSNILMHQALKKLDYHVLNLGVDNQPNFYKDAIIEFGADALLLSSLNGEWKYWLPKLKKSLHFLKTKPLLYLGGNILSLNKKESELELFRIQSYGFKRVFDRNKNFNYFFKCLKKDLNEIT